jgi:probable phosphomutase (TIGR03848 family)
MTMCLLIRHAMTEHVGHVLSGWSPGVHLSALGERQAELLAERLAPVPMSAIYASPIERARETAARIAARHRLEVRAAEAAGEVHFGDWTGRRFSELAHDDAWERWNRARSWTRVPDGEMALEVQARVVALLARLRAEHPEGCIALISHGDVIKLALAHALGSPIDLMQRVDIQPASVTTFVFDAGEVRVLGVNDTGTLPAGA